MKAEVCMPHTLHGQNETEVGHTDTDIMTMIHANVTDICCNKQIPVSMVAMGTRYGVMINFVHSNFVWLPLHSRI